MEKVVDPLGRESEYEYDDLGRLTRQFFPNPATGLASGTRPFTEFTYDLVGNRLFEEDALGHERQWQFDPLNRMTKAFNEETFATLYTYDLVGNVLSLTDAEDNTTAWAYDALDRKTSETIVLDKDELMRLFAYDLVDNLVKKTDRRGWYIDYAYDHLHRMNVESWYGGPEGGRILSFEYDLAGNMTSAKDPDFVYAYQPDNLNRIVNSHLQIMGLSPEIDLDYDYDRMNNRTSLQARFQVGATVTQDFSTSLEHDALNRLAVIMQQDQAGANPNAVAKKRVDVRYDLAGQLFQVKRYAGLLVTNPLVVNTSYQFDKAGRITFTGHNSGVAGAPLLASHTWQWDLAHRITTYTSSLDGAANYEYDDSDQLTDATYMEAPPVQLDEHYLYDNTGNRKSVLYEDNNPLDHAAYWKADDNSGTTSTPRSEATPRGKTTQPILIWTSRTISPRCTTVRSRSLS